MRLTLLALAAFPLLAAPAFADDMSSMPGMSQGTATSPSSQAFKAADDKMMHDMGAPLTGDTDKDFVAGMIPHHQGAIDMAKVELQYGKDPALKKLAADIVKAQEKEIAFMKKWQAAHGG